MLFFTAFWLIHWLICRSDAASLRSESTFGEDVLVPSGTYNPFLGSSVRSQDAQKLFELLFAHFVQEHVNVLDQSNEAHECKAIDERFGTCYEAIQCDKRGGIPMGKCSNAIGYVCCVFERTCGETANERFVYFKGPSQLNAFESSLISCDLNVKKFTPKVVQLKLHLRTFSLAPPFLGNCSEDVFYTSGQNINNRTPKLCGENSNQHYFIQIDESTGVQLHARLRANYKHVLDILVEQKTQNSNDLAPYNCLQYFDSLEGEFFSFNYYFKTSFKSKELVNNYPLMSRASFDLQETINKLSTEFISDNFQGYINNLDYVICFKRPSGYCSIEYEQQVDSFDVGSQDANHLSNTEDHEKKINLCSNDGDYLIIGSNKYCSFTPISEINLTSQSLKIETNHTLLNKPSQSNLLNSVFSSIDSSLSSGLNDRVGRYLKRTKSFDKSYKRFVDDSPGPFFVRFHSNSQFNAKGFQFNYKHIPCK